MDCSNETLAQYIHHAPQPFWREPKRCQFQGIEYCNGEIIRWSNQSFNFHLLFSHEPLENSSLLCFQGISLLALCPTMQKWPLAPGSRRQAGIQDDDEEISSWWQCHTLEISSWSHFSYTLTTGERQEHIFQGKMKMFWHILCDLVNKL